MFPPRPRWDRRRAPPSDRVPTLEHDLGVALREARMARGLYACDAERRFGHAPWLDLELGLAAPEEIRAALARVRSP